MTCSSCCYSAISLVGDSAQAGKLLCRAQPPVPQGIPIPQPNGISIQVVTLWPVVEKNDICGAFEDAKQLKLNG
jgi:hypothetical protein